MGKGRAGGRGNVEGRYGEGYVENVKERLKESREKEEKEDYEGVLQLKVVFE